MKTSAASPARRATRSSRSALVALPLALVLLTAASAAAAAETQIYQQRASDGRIVLTDRPSAVAVTERTWQVEREDPAASRQRALETRREAEAVSERVQRRIEAQERIAAQLDIERMRLAQRDRELQIARADSDRDLGSVIVAPYPVRSFMPRRGPGFEHRHRGRRMAQAPFPG